MAIRLDELNIHQDNSIQKKGNVCSSNNCFNKQRVLRPWESFSVDQSNEDEYEGKDLVQVITEKIEAKRKNRVAPTKKVFVKDDAIRKLSSVISAKANMIFSRIE